MWIFFPVLFFAIGGFGQWPEFVFFPIGAFRSNTPMGVSGGCLLAFVFVFGGLGGLVVGSFSSWTLGRFILIGIGLLNVVTVAPSDSRLRRSLPWGFVGLTAVIASGWAGTRYASQWLDHGYVRTMDGGYLVAVVAGITVGYPAIRQAFREATAATLPALTAVPLAPAAGTTFLAAHLSDLHLTASVGHERIEGGCGGNRAFKELLKAAWDQLLTARLIMITGDVTDGGRKEEWREFFDIYPADLRPRTLLIPGNHDTNFTDTSRPGIVENGNLLRTIRLMRVLAAMDRIQGDRALIIQHNERVLLHDYIVSHDDAFAACRDLAERNTASPESAFIMRRVETIWEEAFPQAIEVDDLVFILLNSNPSPYNILDNAIGEISREQLERMQYLQTIYSQRPLVYLMHHHVALPEGSASMRGHLQIRLLRLRNARQVLSAIPSDRAVAIFHGHRHFGYHGLYAGNVTVVSASSSTLGDEAVEVAQASDMLASFWFFGIEGLGRDVIVTKGPGYSVAIGSKVSPPPMSLRQKFERAAQFVRGEKIGTRAS
ncbi:MAG: metallophosphoesterase [Acidobacteriota bacterium]|nr:metallophosphoesterase [Acidobacteriota bacterium]